MAEISTTQAFSDGDTVTAAKLNNITANAYIGLEAITNRSSETTVDQANDLLLMYDASATALKKVAVSNVIKAGTASNFPVTGNATIGGTLGVTGASTLTGNTTVGGTLGVTGVLSAASTLELGHASDTTLSRGAAGRLQVEGVDVPTISSTDTLTNKTLTSPVISGGTINNAAIGGTTAAAGSFTTLSATSPITTQAGSAAAPAIIPTGDTNTGIFFPAADTIAFSEGGAEAMRIDSSGRVGIGTTSPANKFVVSNNSQECIELNPVESNGPAYYAYNRNTSTWLNAQYFANQQIFCSGGNTERLRIDSSGNVGIGTTSPTDKLTISNGGIDILDNNSINFGSNQAGGATILYNTNGNLDITPRTGYSTIFTSGSVGIGTTSPSAKLHVASGNLRLDDNQYILWGGTTNGINGNNASNLLAFYTNSTERLRIDSSGNCGIGTSSPTQKLNVAGNILATGNITAYSDERIKTNWSSLPEGFVDNLAKVKSGKYERTDIVVNGKNERQIGVSAQSLYNIMPESVIENADENKTLSICYGSASLVSCIELAKEIVKIKSKISELEKI